MELRYSQDELAFRAEVRAFLRDELPSDLRRNYQAGRRATKGDLTRWQRILNKRGWATPNWPREWGGADLSPAKRVILGDELALSGAPDIVGFNARMLGPALIAFGTDEQKRWFLPKLLSMELWFCQGFSEPDSGSDLASLRSSARREGDEYVISGHKIWTTFAHRADWMFGLFRTDAEAKKQRGISFILLDMKSPGVTVKPIITMDGLHETNEVFLDNVRVPASNLIGTEHRGWDVAKFLLANERLSVARPGLAVEALRRVLRAAAQVELDGRPLLESPRIRRKLAELEVEAKAFEILSLRALDAAMKDPQGTKPDPYSSILKATSTELLQRIDALLVEIAGPHAAPYCHEALTGDGAADWIEAGWAATIVPNYAFRRVLTIAGGSSEIQRNIIAKALLAL